MVITIDDEGRAVSPVIGVILMVAIVVILAAIIGLFVLGVGQTDETAPVSALDQSQESNVVVPAVADDEDELCWTTANEASGTKCAMDIEDQTIPVRVTVEHGGGDQIIQNNVEVLVDTTNGTEADSDDVSNAKAFAITPYNASWLLNRTDGQTVDRSETYNEMVGTTDGAWNAPTSTSVKLTANSRMHVDFWVDPADTNLSDGPGARTENMSDGNGGWDDPTVKPTAIWKNEHQCPIGIDFTNRTPRFGADQLTIIGSDTSNDPDWANNGGPPNTDAGNNAHCHGQDYTAIPNGKSDPAIVKPGEDAVGPLHSDDVVRVVWSPPDSPNSQTLDERIVE